MSNSNCKIQKIGIAGVGGVGSNIAVNLIRSGICTLKIVDMDRVEESNLNRQFYFADQIGKKKVDALRENLLRINKKAKIEGIAKEITRENCAALFTDCSIVVEGLDNPVSKKIFLEEMEKKELIVSACGIAGSSLEGIATRNLENCIIVGDFTSNCQELPLFAHKLQTVCGKMTEAILTTLKI